MCKDSSKKLGCSLRTTFTSPSVCLLSLDNRRSMCFKERWFKGFNVMEVKLYKLVPLHSRQENVKGFKVYAK